MPTIILVGTEKISDEIQPLLLVASLSNLEREDLPQTNKEQFQNSVTPYSVILIREELKAVTWDLDKVRRRVKRYRHWNVRS